MPSLPQVKPPARLQVGPLAPSRSIRQKLGLRHGGVGDHPDRLPEAGGIDRDVGPVGVGQTFDALTGGGAVDLPGASADEERDADKSAHVSSPRTLMS